jgi:hypothetical protein
MAKENVGANDIEAAKHLVGVSLNYGRRHARPLSRHIR